MSEFFPNAPLVELVVEVRWDTERVVREEPLDAFETVDPDAQNERLYRKIAAGLADEGFVRSERLVPTGFPIESPNAVLRFSKLGDTEGQVIYHVGPGVFSVNAIPPYQSWDHFRPAVEVGLRVLVEAKAADGTHAQSFERVALRYIDAFRDDFLEGGSRFEFLTEKLGFGFALPSAVRDHMDESDPSVFFQMSTQLGGELELTLRTGEATVSNSPAVVLDITVARTSGSTVSGEVMAVLDSAHEVINSTFVAMTQGVSHILRGGE